jgi:hypothetical protein
VKDKVLWKKIREDISELPLARSEDDFKAAKFLFLKKYKTEDGLKDFLSYFVREHLDQRDGWFEGRAPGFPSTNNGLEATNSWIKRQGTFRERLSLGLLMQFMYNQIASWFMQRNRNSVDAKNFLLEPLLTLNLETRAFNWVSGKPDIKYRTMTNHTMYFISAI